MLAWYEGLDRTQVQAVIEFAPRSLDLGPDGALMLVLLEVAAIDTAAPGSFSEAEIPAR